MNSPTIAQLLNFVQTNAPAVSQTAGYPTRETMRDLIADFFGKEAARHAKALWVCSRRVGTCFLCWSPDERAHLKLFGFPIAYATDERLSTNKIYLYALGGTDAGAPNVLSYAELTFTDLREEKPIPAQSVATTNQLSATFSRFLKEKSIPEVIHEGLDAVRISKQGHRLIIDIPADKENPITKSVIAVLSGFNTTPPPEPAPTA